MPKVFGSDPINPDHGVFAEIPAPDLFVILMLIFIILGIFGIKQLDLVEN